MDADAMVIVCHVGRAVTDGHTVGSCIVLCWQWPAAGGTQAWAHQGTTQKM
jgi:hypothetical protein